MYLSNVDFRFKRVLLKLVEVQLLHWFHTEMKDEKSLTMDYFLLKQLNADDFISWNKSRFFIYQAYYDRLVDDYRREQSFPIDVSFKEVSADLVRKKRILIDFQNDLNWGISLIEAEKHAIKLDLEWIGRLRKAWLHPVSEQFCLQGKPLVPAKLARRSTMVPKQNRRVIRLSVAHIKVPPKIETNNEEMTDEQSIKTIDDYSHQKFVNSRLSVNNNNLSQFQLYILPVRV